MSFFSRNPVFVKPQGFCFFTDDETDAITISDALRDATLFFQAEDPNQKLYRYDDWWQHDGLHFQKARLNFSDVTSLIGTPKALLESTPDDFAVFVGIAPEDSSWYMRYRVEWNEEDTSLTGQYAVILNPTDAVRFRKIDSTASLNEVEADTYYEKVIR